MANRDDCRGLVFFTELEAVGWRSLDILVGLVAVGGAEGFVAVRDRVFIAGAEASTGATVRLQRFGAALAMTSLGDAAGTAGVVV